MITIDDKPIRVEHFNDHTPHIWIDTNLDPVSAIKWYYEDERECMELYYVVNHIRDLFSDAYITLFLPYLPNARLDRTKPNTDQDEVLTLKWFAKFINDLHFNRVITIDPHSNVSKALFDHLDCLDIHSHIDSAMIRAAELEGINSESFTLITPDEGAAKRYCIADWGRPYLFGAKERDWDTRALKSYTLIGDHNLVKNHHCFIIDDIFSSGGTLRMAAEELKKLGAKSVYAWATHTENNPIINIEPIKKLYTTDSIKHTFVNDNIDVTNALVTIGRVEWE